MYKILKFLSGKKGAIASIIALTATFLVSENLLTIAQAAYINGLSFIVFGAASIATKSVVYK